MESRPQNPEFRNNPVNLHPCIYQIVTADMPEFSFDFCTYFT